ncbi:hypothetical protein [Pseudonocardia endophytica]|uniref:Integral membrane protein n=1 Tax=Pseudonocardia endophytica TaxID=401976 RepID=A0A4R1HYG5_PSEEN|nr:hypothetical protein [Pseudonocardia endophytica]TCK22612.1 hypothetical protein EV378_6620 [Pseudonocardia endophytica]
MSAAVRTGLVLLGLLSLVDVVGVFTTDGTNPPMSIAVLGTVLGLISLVLIWWAWRGERWPTVALVVVRLVSAATAVPAFFVGDVPGGVVVFAGALVLLTLVGCGLVLPALRRAGAGAR